MHRHRSSQALFSNVDWEEERVISKLGGKTMVAFKVNFDTFVGWQLCNDGIIGVTGDGEALNLVKEGKPAQ